MLRSRTISRQPRRGPGPVASTTTLGVIPGFGWNGRWACSSARTVSLSPQGLAPQPSMVITVCTEPLPKVWRAHDHCALVILQGTGHDLGRRRRGAVDQDHHGEAQPGAARVRHLAVHLFAAFAHGTHDENPRI